MMVDPADLVAATLVASMPYEDFWDAPSDAIPQEVYAAMVDVAEARLAV